MIFDLLHDSPGPEDFTDVCVVGAGAAGICLAIELSRQGKTVSLLEGGGREIEDAAQEPYESEVVGLEHRGVHTGRFRALGGTTNKWGGQIRELDAEDFSKRDWIAGSGWPISRDDLKPYYARALELEGVAGSLQSDAAVWRALHVQAPELPDLDAYFTRWCPEPSFVRVHGKELKESQRIRVWLHANVTEAEMQDGAVRSLRCRTQARQEARFRARHFVFCMGTIECVRFFLQPRESGLPWNESGLLGFHFQDHIDADTADVQPLNRKRFSDLFDNASLRGYKYHPKVRLAPSEQQRRGLLNCGATMSFLGNSDQTVVRMKTTAQHIVRGRLDAVSGQDLAWTARHAPLFLRHSWRYLVEHRAYNSASFGIKLRAHCEQDPLTTSRITLSEERDSLGLLRTSLEWRISEEELRTLREFAVLAAESLAGIATVVPSPALLEGGAAAVALCDDSNHHMGGMRMDASARRGVVSTELRVHGTSNCYVCSGAVFPTSGFSNPTHTVLALAVRLADHLSRQ